MKRVYLLVAAMALLCLCAASCWAVLPWYANNLLTYVPSSPGVNWPVTYDWSAVQAHINSVTPGGVTWSLQSSRMWIRGPNGYSVPRDDISNWTQPWYFPTVGIYTVSLSLTYKTSSAVVDPSGGPASTAHVCIAPAVTYVTLPPVSVSAAKQQADGAFVHLTSKVVTYAGPDFLYVEDDNRSCGIRVDVTDRTVTAGMRVDIKGTLQTDGELERSIAASMLVENGRGTVAPLAMPNKSIGGGDWLYNAVTGAGQKRVENGVGLNNIGLLVKTTGRVISFSSGGICFINDGSGSNLRVEVPGVIDRPAQMNQYVQVTGISGITAGPMRVLRARSAADLVVEQAPAVYLYNTAPDTAQQFKTLLGANKIKVDLVPMSAAEAVDYDKYSLIIIGWDTSTGSNWGSIDLALTISDANCPTLGIETGGARCFGWLSLNMGAPYVSYNKGRDIETVDTASPIYNTPYVIRGNTHGRLVVSTNLTGWYGSSYLNPIPIGVVALGNKLEMTNDVMLAWEQGRYMYWPFRDAPDILTDAGRKLFVNAAWYAMQQP